jgi:hypothetical protein
MASSSETRKEGEPTEGDGKETVIPATRSTETTPPRPDVLRQIEQAEVLDLLRS